MLFEKVIQTLLYVLQYKADSWNSNESQFQQNYVLSNSLFSPSNQYQLIGVLILQKDLNKFNGSNVASMMNERQHVYTAHIFCIETNYFYFSLDS